MDTFSVELTPIEVEQLQCSSPQRASGDEYFPTKLNLSLDDMESHLDHDLDFVERDMQKLSYDSQLKDSANEL